MATLDIAALTRAYIAELVAPTQAAPLERLAACDDQRGVYCVTTVGWQGARRIAGLTLLVVLRDARVIIHHDGTPGFADYLIASGLPEDAITLAFQQPDLAVA